jgi:hypothetical protein
VAGFSAADAAFTGFRVVWERPWAVAIWAAVQLVVSLALNLFVAVSAGPAAAQLTQVNFDSQADLQKAMDLFRQTAPTYLVMLFVALVLLAVFAAAMNRAVLRPSESRFGYMRLASDELRQLGLFIVLLLLLCGFYFAVLIVASVIVGVLIALAGNAAGVAATAALIPAVVCALIFFGVRLSLASPLTFASGRVNVFGSWAMTRGRFWQLFGAYLIAFALGVVVRVLTLVIALLAVAILGGGLDALKPVMQSDFTTVAANLAPLALVYLAISSIGGALTAPITMCPPPAIYQSMTGGAPANASRPFA